MQWHLLSLLAGVCYAADEAVDAAAAAATTAVDETPDTPENQENEEKKTKEDEPAGDLTRDYQYIFSQGTYSFDGFDIVSPVRSTVNVGRLDGQTGWIGVNQAGEKTMSYQIAFVIKADTKLNSMFWPLGAQGRSENQTSQLGWWIPSRGEDIPPEDWTMNLMDINIAPTVTQSTIRWDQSLFKEGLYTAIGSRIETPYNLASKDDKNKHEQRWTFDGTTGQLASSEKTGDSVLPDSNYFVPIAKDTTISEDRLVIAIEGTSLKQWLPEVRWGSKLPFYFQILDFEVAPVNAWKIRQRNIVELTFSEDPNHCTRPATCIYETDELELDGAASIWATAAASLTLLSMTLF